MSDLSVMVERVAEAEELSRLRAENVALRREVAALRSWKEQQQRADTQRILTEAMRLSAASSMADLLNATGSSIVGPSPLRGYRPFGGFLP